MPGLVKALEARFARDQNPPIIYATGHSLGGGLAQQLAYMSRSVKAAITFNTTPVTNWSSLRFEPRAIENDYPTIYRLEHGGEFLSFPRYIASAATKARFGRYDIVLQIDERSLFGGHAIGIFACRFAELVAKGDSLGAEHHYPRAYAQHILAVALNENGPVNSDRNICKEQAYLINQRPKVDGPEQRGR
jgi:pimeloyl-ACP methyl ester carboxylesterase